MADGDTGAIKGPLRGHRVHGTINIPKLLSIDSATGLKTFEGATAGTKIAGIYWKKGIIDYFGSVITAVDLLSMPGTQIQKFVAQKIDGAADTLTGAAAFEVAPAEGVFASNPPRGSFRQVSIGILLNASVQLTDYVEGEAAGQRSFRHIKLAYNRKDKISLWEWYNWLVNTSGKASEIEAMVTPDGATWTLPDVTTPAP
ncbi:MAG: hypothetical protein DSM107014_12905 [Gomphosphaeria aponina SAG 52.96 = DSM 107014]|uniref:Uncharacterized protein n=1 Tax=Gomphosphaeria aponina SAG 52.96 = DSM 107014 TaxID=1521640 RepID=A0A941JMZ4_9CHRO|nr:hypothetical protein [Gomphosphaeria aponina SAG 52.96 = DSM 107014]